MKLKLAVLIVIALTLFAGAPARAEDMSSCSMTTISSLQTCVEHAASMGAFDNSGILQSVQAKLAAAQAAADQGNPAAAANILQALIQEVSAQAGQHIEAEHAAHIVMHAEMVIQALLAP